MKIEAERISVCLALIFLLTGNSVAIAGEASSPQFNEERSKQEQIYQSTGDQRPDGYVIDRPLSRYAEALSPGFDRALWLLGPSDRWLDIGAGAGQAILDYVSPALIDGRLRSGGMAQAVAMSIEDRRNPAWNRTAENLKANTIRYLANKRLRDYTLEELGRFQLITDVIGGFSYVENLSRYMENVLGFLQLNGTFFTVLQDVHSEEGTNKPFYPNAAYLTVIKKPDGADLKVCDWLKSISCVAVTCELKPGWKPPIESYSIRKTCNEVKVPALDTIHFVAGTPPERRFQLAR